MLHIYSVSLRPSHRQTVEAKIILGSRRGDVTDPFLSAQALGNHGGLTRCTVSLWERTSHPPRRSARAAGGPFRAFTFLHKRPPSPSLWAVLNKETHVTNIISGQKTFTLYLKNKKVFLCLLVGCVQASSFQQ